MSDREKLQEVEYTSPTGFSTKVRTRHPERYSQGERAQAAQSKEREPVSHRARQPKGSEDVATK